MSERIGCKHCDFKGYIKSSVFKGADDSDEGSTSVRVCSHCEDYRGYHAYVRSKYGSKKSTIVEKPTAKILGFNEYKQRRKKETGE